MGESIQLTTHTFTKRQKLITFLIFALIFFSIGAYRHIAFRSTALDLGIFSQATWLISQGEVPVSSYIGRHILGDHGSWILYILALSYWLIPSPLTLIAIQSLALAASIFPICRLAKKFSSTEQKILCAILLMHPTIWASALFDFHPDTIAFPLLLWTAVFATEKKEGAMLLCGLLAGGCKEVLNCSVFGIGLWAFLSVSRSCGLLLMVLSISQAVFLTEQFIPLFGGFYSSGIDRFAALGQSPLQILVSLITAPHLIFSELSPYSFKAVTIIFLPFAVWLYYSFKSEKSKIFFTSLLTFLPAFFINMLAAFPTQRAWAFHYQLPILAGLIIVSTRREEVSPLHLTNKAKKSAIAICIGIFIFAMVSPNIKRPGLKPLPWLQPNNLAALKEGILKIDPSHKVLTTWEIAPHLSHRSEIALIGETPHGVEYYNTIIFNFSSPLKPNSNEFAQKLNEIAKEKGFVNRFDKDGVLILSQE